MIDDRFAPWGFLFLLLMYFLGSAAWLQPLARKRLRWGWLVWAGALAFVLLFAMAIEVRIGAFANITEAWRNPDPEKHWIIALVFALLSTPAAASVMLRQTLGWTRFAVIGSAWLLFAPAGTMLSGSLNDHALAVGGVLLLSVALWLWTGAIDRAPATRRAIKEQAP